MTTGKRLSLFFYFFLLDLNQQSVYLRSLCGLLIWEEADRRRWRSKGGGCPPVRGMSRSDKGSAVSGEERMTHERTRLRPSCRSTRRFVIPYGR